MVYETEQLNLNECNANGGSMMQILSVWQINDKRPKGVSLSFFIHKYRKSLALFRSTVYPVILYWSDNMISRRQLVLRIIILWPINK